MKKAHYTHPNKSTVALSLVLLHETERAIKVSEDGTEKSAVWIPKSQILEENKVTIDKDENSIVVIEIPEWLAYENNLI